MKAIFFLTNLIVNLTIALNTAIPQNSGLSEAAVMEAPLKDRLPSAYRELLPQDTEIPARLPAKITDPFLLAAWVVLYNQTDPITIHDQITLSGRSLAEIVLAKNVEILWSSNEICNGNSCSLRPTCKDAACVVSYKRTKLNPVYISLRYNEETPEMLVKLAGSLAHELYHYQWPFGPIETTLFEEYWAYYIGSQIRQDHWGEFNSYNPYNAACLKSWFADMAVQGYYTAQAYPFTLKADVDLSSPCSNNH
jgi:hypothetical protein